jgi:toxin HigB-1
MEIVFGSKKLKDLLNDSRKIQAKYGERSKKVMQRMHDLAAAESLTEVFQLPATGCHELKGDRKWQFAVNVGHPYRLIFEPSLEPIPKKTDGGIDLTRVTAIRILDIIDYH